MRRGRFTTLLALAPVLVFGCAYAQGESDEIERLVALCKLWSAVKYFHPYLAYRTDIDWDKALVEAIPKVTASNTVRDYKTAVESMVATLHDPATRVVERPIAPNPDQQSVNRERDPQFKLNSEGILLVRMNHYDDLYDYVGTTEKMARIKKEIGNARGIVFDLRPTEQPNSERRGFVSHYFKTSGIASSLAEAPIAAPGERLRMNVGFVPQGGFIGGDYTRGFYVKDGERIQPAEKVKGMPVVFLVNPESELPGVALALQSANKAAVVAEGGASDASAVSTQLISLTPGVAVQIRLGELVYEDGTGGFAADVTVPSSRIAGEENPAWKAALAMARSFSVHPASRGTLSSQAAPLPEKPYAEMTYPSSEYRVLAAFRLWAAINYFYPYREFMGEDWDAVLRSFIPRMERAGSALEYVQSLAEMATHIHDGHVAVGTRTLREYFGTAAPPFGVRMIEGLPVVTRLDNQAVTKSAGLEIGDIILRVDGEEASARMARIAKYVPSSTTQWLNLLTANRMLRGPDKSMATLVIRDRNEKVREVKVPRSVDNQAGLTTAGRTGDIVRILPGNIGYADLERLTVPAVDEMFEKLKNTKAIIFDVRDYPQGTAWAIAPRLTEKSDVAAALFQRHVAMNPDAPNGELLTVSTTQSFVQRLPATSGWRYKGKTIMLIDERTISQAEHTGLFFDAANGTKFVGSPTAGANGDITYLVAPGGVSISFSGQAVRHADGRQLQRIGLKPDVEVTPTLAGIRAGRDEVLDKAVEYIDQSSK
jgi:C-terminal processing protease CtpA/Prc